MAIIAPTLAMSSNVSLAAQAAGPAAPLAFAIGTGVMVVVGLSFVLWSRRVAHAGSAYGFITQAFGKGWGFLAGWALLLSYLTYGAGASALTGNFLEAAARTAGWHGPGVWLVLGAAAIVAATLLASLDMRIAGRTMFLLEGLSLLGVVLLSLLILARAAPHHELSVRPFAPSAMHGGWAGVGYAMVFAVLSFGGFEAAATLGEEMKDPRRDIPLALLGTLLLAGLLYVVICYAQVIGYGLENTGELATDAAPLDTLAVRYVSRMYAVTLDVAAALGAFSCLLGSLSAAGRMLYALGRAGLASAAGRLHPKRATPTNAIVTTSAVCLLCLMVWGPKAGAHGYYGAMGTVGTLAIILVYMGVAWAQARSTGKAWYAAGSLLGITGALLLVWPLFNSLYPIPTYPDNLWPFLALGWLGSGVLLLRMRPALMRQPLAEVAITEPTL